MTIKLRPEFWIDKYSNDNNLSAIDRDEYPHGFDYPKTLLPQSLPGISVFFSTGCLVLLYLSSLLIFFISSTPISILNIRIQFYSVYYYWSSVGFVEISQIHLSFVGSVLSKELREGEGRHKYLREVHVVQKGKWLCIVLKKRKNSSLS